MLNLLLPFAHAADLTVMPDAMEAQVSFGYTGFTEDTGLSEAGIRIADRSHREHTMTFAAAFAPTKGVALHVAGDLAASWNTTFTNHRQMLLEPVDGGGSYLDGEVLDTPVVLEGSGLNGIWFGVSLSPFSEAYAKHHRVTWKLDLAARTGSKKSNRWTVDGNRGGGPGGSAFRVAGAFSRRTGASEPYVAASYQNEGSVEVQVIDEQGLGGLLDLDPANIADLRGGVEVHTSASDSFTIDLWGGARYTTPEQIPSGLLLPSVLPSAKTIAITHSDTLAAQFGLNLHVTFASFLRGSLGGFGRFTVPHTAEHVFPVSTTTDALTLGWTAKLVGTFGDTSD